MKVFYINHGNLFDRATPLFLNLLKKIFFLLSMWFLWCFVWVLTESIKTYGLELAENASSYKASCVNVGGKVRHDSRLLSVDVYCQLPSGYETTFRHKTTLTYSHFMLTLMDRLLFDKFELRQKYGVSA